jgi:superoxide dismutase, Fe-Mn family
MNYTAQQFDHLLGLSGFSDTLLQNHFTLYQGYVTNTNAVSELLKQHEAGTPVSNELRRRFGWEFSGMKLHELYFGNLNKESAPMTSGAELETKIIEQYASVDGFMAEWRKMGLTRGIGWVTLAYDKQVGRLFTSWIGEHDMGTLVGSEILLIMDVWEHAFITDYGIKRPGYIESFIAAIDWKTVENRLAQASNNK